MGVTAEVRFTGGEVQRSHLIFLAKYLELAKSAIETEDNDAELRSKYHRPPEMSGFFYLHFSNELLVYATAQM